jgi:phosphate uptake regulator
MKNPTQQHVLRSHLLDMAKLSQRAVDYATKGYRLGSPEFCRYVRNGDRQLRELRRSIEALCQKPSSHEPGFHEPGSQEPRSQEPAIDPDAHPDKLNAVRQLRFSRSALRIADALHAVCTATAEIAHHSMLLLEDADWVPRCEALEKACYLVNRLMCLCIVALFKRECQHAKAVLQSREGRRLFEQAFQELRTELHNGTGPRSAIPTALELAISNSLKQIANQTHEIAEAIVFWLEGKKCVVESGAGAH